MSSLELLLSRQSHNKLIAPAPTKAQMDNIFKAALRAPDHALLRPWRYRVYEGVSLLSLGDLFAEAMKKSDPELSELAVEKARSKPLRAPMVVIASVVLTEHPKVPEIEQWLSAGASVQNILQAAHFQGIGAMWRTGSLAFNENLMALIGFEENEKIVGFIYLGKEEGNKKSVREIDVNEFVKYV